MKPFTTVLLACAFALTSTLAEAQSDPHHPAADAGDAPAATDNASPETGAPQPQKTADGAACPNTPSMMMDMMAMMEAGGAAMPMMQMMSTMQMMQAAQLEMMRNMTTMQEQMALMQQRLDDLTHQEEKSP